MPTAPADARRSQATETVAPPAAHADLPARRWTAGTVREERRPVPEEVPIALTYGRAAHAVMMASPRDLEDFGIGFSLTEGIIADPAELAEIELVDRPAGIELRMTLAEDRQEALTRRRRHMAGPVGCGLCGLESLEAVLRPLPAIAAATCLPAADIARALEAMAAGQALHHATHAVHAAGFWHAARGLLCLREDVGRHNALDKLVGALRRQGIDPGEGAVVLTSRVSVEMVQKTAILGAPILVAVSAPTALAVRNAEGCGLTLVARARGGSFDIHAHPQRITGAG
jgi:FdhD protein